MATFPNNTSPEVTPWYNADGNACGDYTAAGDYTQTINEIKEKTGVDEINIEDDGTVYITGKNNTANKASAVIQSLLKDFKPRK